LEIASSSLRLRASRYRVLYPIENPHIEALLRFLGRVAEAGQIIVAEEFKVTPWGADHKLRGWKVMRDGYLLPARLGFRDPQDGAFWPLIR
jgi:hypothetical protein